MLDCFGSITLLASTLNFVFLVLHTLLIINTKIWPATCRVAYDYNTRSNPNSRSVPKNVTRFCPTAC